MAVFQIAFDFNGLTFLTTGFLLLSNHADSAIEGETAGITTKGQRCAFTIARLGYGRSMGLKTRRYPKRVRNPNRCSPSGQAVLAHRRDQQRIVSEESSFLPDRLRGSDNDLIHGGEKKV